MRISCLRFWSHLLITSVWAAGLVRPPFNYYYDIKPVLAVHCHKCHDGEKPKGGLRLDSRTNALAGGKSADAAIVPGASARSELVRRIALREGDEMMPPKGARLTEAEVSRIQQWIDEGAKWPERDDSGAAPRSDGPRNLRSC